MRARLLVGLSLLLTFGLMDPAAALRSLPSDGAVLRFDPAAVLTSDNVTYHGTIPIDSPAVGGEPVVREDLGGKRFFYVTGFKGLSIYDVTIPAVPVLAGHLPFPHAQNEDLKVSDDGRTVMIAADGAFLVGVNPVTTGITIIDVTNPALPRIVASNNDRVMGRYTAAGIAEHTAECANADCSVIYGRTGRTYAVDRELGTVDVIGQWHGYTDPETGDRLTPTQIHALNRDETGIVIADSTPRLVLDPTGTYGTGTGTPEQPEVLAIGPRPGQDNRLQHNNVRTDAADWVARGPGDDIVYVEVPERTRSISVVDQRPVMRPGELMIGNSESNLNVGCGTAGGLSTWSMIDFDQGAQMQALEVFRPLNGTWLDGSPAANALGCSGHWFTESDGVVAASWYEHGVRFFDIDKEIGTIDEIGFFQPVVTEAGAAYWIDDSFVYSVDYVRGIDIVSFDREGQTPSEDELVSSWLANLGQIGAGAAVERFFCSLAAAS